MPSRQRKQPENRRRTGCFQCKEKHVQCTEEKPSCKRCQRLGLQCVRGIKLLFREDAIERGIHFGREGTWSKRCNRIKKPPVLELDDDFTGVPLTQYIGNWIWLNTTYGDFTGELDGQDDESRANELELSRFNSDVAHWALKQQHQNEPIYHPMLNTRLLGNQLSYYPHSEAYLLDYFINGIGPNCSLSSSHNPYMSLIPLLSYETLRNTILAVSAKQLFLLGDARYFKEACKYKQKALTGLKHVVGSSAVDFGAVASVLMLCFHDITDDCLPSWTTHLRGGLDMIKYLPTGSAQMESLKRFFNMWFVAHDIMTRTAPLDFDYSPEHQWLENDDLDEIDATVGCSRRLMSLLSQTTNLVSQRRNAGCNTHSIITSNFIKSCEDIGIGFENLHQKLPSLTPPTESFILQIAEIKRLTALLYFTENLGDLIPPSAHSQTSTSYYSSWTPGYSVYPSSSSSSSSSTFPSHTPFKQPSKQRLVSSIIDLISTLPNPNTVSVTWPLYIIGHSTGLEDEAQRRFVLERLRAIQQSRNLGNVHRVRLSVERAFRTTDLDLPTSKSSPRKKVVGNSRARIISLA